MDLTNEEPLLLEDGKGGRDNVNGNHNGGGNSEPGRCFTFLLIPLFILYSITVVILFIRGINVSLVEYKDIPTCASQFKWWIISVLVLNAICILYILAYFVCYTTQPLLIYVKYYSWVNMCVAWVVAPIGYIVVLYKSDQNCDTTHIAGIVMWTRDVLIFLVPMFVVSLLLFIVAHILYKKQNIRHEDRGMVATGVDPGQDNIEQQIHQCDNV